LASAVYGGCLLGYEIRVLKEFETSLENAAVGWIKLLFERCCTLSSGKEQWEV